MFIFDDLHSTSVIRYALLAYMGYMSTAQTRCKAEMTAHIVQDLEYIQRFVACGIGSGTTKVLTNESLCHTCLVGYTDIYVIMYILNIRSPKSLSMKNESSNRKKVHSLP